MSVQKNTGQKPAKWQAKPAMESKPPKALMKVMNPIMTLMVRRGGGRMGDQIMLLTFRGRKSGRQFTTPIGYTREGNVVTCFTDSQWGKNLVGGAPVKVTIKGKEKEGYAETTSDKGQVLEYVKHNLSKGGPQAARQMGLSLPKGYLPSDDELRTMLRDRILISIKLQGK